MDTKRNEFGSRPSSLLLLAFVVWPLSAAEPPIPAAGPEAVLSELRIAHEARAQRLREHQDWHMEKQRLELLRQTLRREALRLEATADEASQKADTLERSLSGEQDQENTLVALNLMIERLADQTDQKLEALATRTAPGLVPPPQPPDSPRPEARFLAAIRRLDQARRQAENSAVELVSGSLDGKPETVKLLRLGGVAAWWLSLNGARAGLAEWKSGELRLRPGSSEEHRSIATAFSILEAGAAPDWVVLPIRRAETK